MKTRTTFLLGVALVGCLFALTCGGVAVCLGLLHRWQSTAVLADPVDVAAAGASVAELNVPAAMAPKSGLRMDVPLTDRPLVAMAMYEGTEPLRYLMLFAIDDEAVHDTTALEAQIENMLETATSEATKDLVLDREWTQTLPVRGVPVDFHLRRYKNVDGTVEVNEATGMFEGGFGPATLVWVTIGPFDEPDFRAMLE